MKYKLLGTKTVWWGMFCSLLSTGFSVWLLYYALTHWLRMTSQGALGITIPTATFVLAALISGYMLHFERLRSDGASVAHRTRDTKGVLLGLVSKIFAYTLVSVVSQIYAVGAFVNRHHFIVGSFLAVVGFLSLVALIPLWKRLVVLFVPLSSETSE